MREGIIYEPLIGELLEAETVSSSDFFAGEADSFSRFVDLLSFMYSEGFCVYRMETGEDGERHLTFIRQKKENI